MQNQYRPITDNCHKCGKKGHFAKDCRASQYLVEMYQESKQLRNRPTRQNYNFEATDLSAMDYEVENFMTIYEQPTSNQDVALLDRASTHTLFNKAQLFYFQSEKS